MNKKTVILLFVFFVLLPKVHAEDSPKPLIECGDCSNISIKDSEIVSTGGGLIKADKLGDVKIEGSEYNTDKKSGLKEFFFNNSVALLLATISAIIAGVVLRRIR